jgi:hypothetical protein
MGSAQGHIRLRYDTALHQGLYISQTRAVPSSPLRFVGERDIGNRRLSNRPRNASNGEALPPSEPVPRRLMSRVTLITYGCIEHAKQTDLPLPARPGILSAVGLP